MADLSVLIVGAGPSGLTLAIELARRGVDFRIIDRERTRPTTSRAIGTQRRTTEVFQMMGIPGSALHPSVRLRGLRLSDGTRTLAPLRFDPGEAGVMIMDETDTERVLEERLGQLGGAVEYGRELTTFRDEGNRLVGTVRDADGTEEIPCQFLIGADGAHSAVREAAGIGFTGITYPEQFLLADLDLEWEVPHDEGRIWVGDDGLVAALPLPGDRRWRIIAATTANRYPDHLSPGELAALAERLLRVRSKTPFRLIGEPAWVSAFHVHRRIADRYVQGRVLLVGDAAHIHSPVGAQGMNTGIQDAFNLGWKLALAARGVAAPGLLDSYQTERHAVAAAVLRGTDLGTRLMLGRNPLSRAIREQVVPMLADVAPVRRRLLDAVAEVTIGYRSSPLSVNAGNGHGPQRFLARERGLRAGERVPNATLHRGASGDAVALLDLFSSGWTLLLFPGEAGAAADVAALTRDMVGDRVSPYLVLGTAGGTDGDIPVLVDVTGGVARVFSGERGAIALIRPDGYLGFRGEPGDLGDLASYLARIFAMHVADRTPVA